MSPYAGISQTTLQARLTEAQEALHAIQTGRRVLSVRTPMGSQVTYSDSAADLQSLAKYIADLQVAIGLTTTRPRCIGFYVGGGKGL